jgi:ABC-2 type transport system permease protein
LLKNGKLDAALYAPEWGLTRQFEKGEASLQAVIDGCDLIRARGINGYLGSIVMRTVGERLGRPNDYPYRASAQTKRTSSLNAPMEFMVRVLYNPEFVTSYNLVPGVLCMITCIITIMLTSMSIAKEKEAGTFETLISAPVTITEILLGKTLPYLIIGGVNLPMIFFVAVAGFDVPMRGSYLALAIATFFFLATTVSIGTLISTIAKNQQQAMMGSFIFLMPAILLSGIMYPIDNLPLILKLVSWLNPLMYYTILLRNIMLKGGDAFVVAAYTGALFLISVVSVGLAFKKFKLHLG